MLGVFPILLFCTYIAMEDVIWAPIRSRAAKKDEHTEKVDKQIKKLWQVAQDSMKTKKPLRAEKALLTILKFDQKNAAAYNRLGILYAKESNYDEAIECFEIAQSLDNNASSLHNVGLIYYETGAYEKAAMAFEQAIELESDMPARYIALAHAYNKMGQRKNAIEALENAFSLDHSVSTLREILALYEESSDTENIELTTARIEAKIAEETRKKELENSYSKHMKAKRQSHPVVKMQPTKFKKREFFPPVVQPKPKTATKTTTAKPIARKTLSNRRKLIQ